MDTNQSHCRVLVKKEKKKTWAKQTKIIQERVGSAVSSFFGGKKSESPAILSSKAIGKSNGARLDRSSSQTGAVKASRTRTFLSKLLKKGKIKHIPEKSQSELGQGKEEKSNLNRVLSRRGVSAKPKLKIARSLRSKGSKNNRLGGESEPSDHEDPGIELCKKRILMGGKCKPLEDNDCGDNGMYPER